MSARTLLLATLLTLGSHAWSAADLTSFPFVREVQGTDHAQQLSAVPLPAAIYAHLDDQLANLRLVDVAKYAVPHRIRPTTDTRTAVTSRTVSAKIDTLNLTDGGEIEVLLSRQQSGATVHGMRVETSLRDYEQTVHIYSRPTPNSPWQPLVKGAMIFDYSRFMNVRQTRLNFPPTTDAEFRVVIEKPVADRLAVTYEVTDQNDKKTPTGGFVQTRRMVEERPFHIDSITLLQDSTETVPNQIRRCPYPPRSAQASIDAKSGHSITILEMGREPVSAILFTTTENNFSRTVRVAVEEPTPTGLTWREIAISRLYCIGTTTQNQQNLAVEFAEIHPSRLRITVENGPQAPIPFTAITPDGIAYELQFVVPKTPGASLYYGGSVAPAPLDTAPIELLFSAGNPVVHLTLGSETANPQAHGSPATIFGNPVLFAIAVLLMVLALGWALFRAARNLPAPPT